MTYTTTQYNANKKIYNLSRLIIDFSLWILFILYWGYKYISSFYTNIIVIFHEISGANILDRMTFFPTANIVGNLVYIWTIFYSWISVKFTDIQHAIRCINNWINQLSIVDIFSGWNASLGIFRILMYQITYVGPLLYSMNYILWNFMQKIYDLVFILSFSSGNLGYWFNALCQWL